MPGPRVVMLSPVLPTAEVTNAGAGYVRDLVATLDADAELTLIVPDTPVNRAARDSGSAPAALLVGADDDPRLAARVMRAARATADRRHRQVDPGAASFVLRDGLRRPGPVRDALASADVVDLQWSEMVRLARTVRSVGPRARVVGTFHDVQSQLFAREPARHRLDPLYWRWAAALSRRHERRGVRDLDVVLTFSDKDLNLLGNPPNGRVVRPPLAPTGPPSPHDPQPPGSTVLFVAHLARPENDAAAHWLLADIWPHVVAADRTAELRLVGSGAGPGLVAAVDAAERAVLTGFVGDLDAEYAAARCVVVPLRHGAGVKFKTVEALLRGVPVVTTPVGAEGIGGPELFAGYATDPRRLAGAVVEVLRAPRAAARRADESRRWSVEAYGAAQFARAVRAAYGLGG